MSNESKAFASPQFKNWSMILIDLYQEKQLSMVVMKDTSSNK